MLTVAHRGFSAIAPENTLAAFREALSTGVNAVEFDVHLTADGVPVVMHDETLERTTNGSGPVAAIDMAALARLDAGSWFAPQFAGEHVPTLRETLELLRGQLTLCIELKAPGTAAATVTLLRELDMSGQAIIFSFHEDYLREVAALAPDLRRLLLLVGNPDHPSPVDADVWIASARRLGVSYLGLLHKSILEPHVEAIHNAVMQLITWTIDDTDRMCQLASWGVDGIASNDARSLVSTLRQ